MTTEYEAKMLRDLNGSLNDLLVRMQCWEQWIISYVDMRTAMCPDAEVRLVIGHRSIHHGNAMYRIDCAEVERIEPAPTPGHINRFRKVTENGFRISCIPESPGDTEQECFDVLTARDALAALYGFVVCHHADFLESVKRSESEPR